MTKLGPEAEECRKMVLAMRDSSTATSTFEHAAIRLGILFSMVLGDAHEIVRNLRRFSPESEMANDVESAMREIMASHFSGSVRALMVQAGMIGDFVALMDSLDAEKGVRSKKMPRAGSVTDELN